MSGEAVSQPVQSSPDPSRGETWKRAGKHGVYAIGRLLKYMLMGWLARIVLAIYLVVPAALAMLGNATVGFAGAVVGGIIGLLVPLFAYGFYKIRQE